MPMYIVTSQQSPPARIHATSRMCAIRQYVNKNRGYLTRTAYRNGGKIWAKKVKYKY